MNLKKILCLAIAAGVSSHALALEIYQGHVISEKSWSTDGKKVTLAKHKSAGMMTNRGNPQFQYVYASIDATTTKVGQPVTLDNYTSVSVQNDTASNKTYSVLHSVCATIADNTEHCTYHRQDLELYSNGYFKDDTVPQLTLSFDKAGLYKTSAGTVLIDKTSGFNYAASSFAASDIVVS